MHRAHMRVSVPAIVCCAETSIASFVVNPSRLPGQNSKVTQSVEGVRQSSSAHRRSTKASKGGLRMPLRLRSQKNGAPRPSRLLPRSASETHRCGPVDDWMLTSCPRSTETERGTPAILSLSRQKLDVSVLCDDLPRAATCCSRKRSSPLGATDFPSSTNTRRWQDGHCQVSCLANAIICIIAIPPHPGVPLFLDQQLGTFVSTRHAGLR